jgi:hypothetical protein
MNYWQVAAGSDQRDYTQDFLKYGMAFVGGETPVETMKAVECGDRVILKRGMSQIVAVGTVVERNGKCKGNACDEQAERDRQWLRDYDGWDLSAYCIVEWHRPAEPATVKGLTRATIQQVWQTDLRQKADDILASAPVMPICAEPQCVAPLNDDEMLEFLIEEGLRPSTADELTATLKRIRLLAKYYWSSKDVEWSNVREHETRTFLIVPFLLALGWSEQQIKIELPVAGGRRVDVACFRRAYRKRNDECVLLLESKGFSQGLDYAHQQGKDYAAAFPQCRVVVASNGYCYKAYRRKTAGEGFEPTPSAYLNLLRPTKQYPLNPSLGGGLKLLSYILPNSSLVLAPETTKPPRF